MIPEPQPTVKRRRLSARFHRNSSATFLLGASWVHRPSFSRRLTHIYLGPWLLTITHTPPEPNAQDSAERKTR